MKIKNAVTKEYMKQNDRFADLCNYYLFHGEQVIRSEELVERDVTELALPYKNKELYSTEKLRDLLKSTVIKQFKTSFILLIGLEGQSEIHYAMPVRDMLYDALKYTDQIQELSKKHHLEKDLKTPAEFLSGLAKEDRLHPVITLTIYWNTGAWDGPRSLHEMLETQEPEILNYVSDYKLNLIVPEELKDFDRFHTELGFLLEFFQHADNADALEQFITNKQTNESALSIDAIHLLNTCLNAGIELPDQKEDVHVCKGIDELIARGERRGEVRGEARGKQTTLINLVKDGLLDITEAARRIEMDVEEFKLLLNTPMSSL